MRKIRYLYPRLKRMLWWPVYYNPVSGYLLTVLCLCTGVFLHPATEPQTAQEKGKF